MSPVETYNPRSEPDRVQPIFARIVCGLDGSRRSRDAATQAMALARPGTALTFVCVRSSAGVGPTYRSSIGLTRAQDALDAAVKQAAAVGVQAQAELLPGDEPAAVLMEQAYGADLLIVGSHGGTRIGGIMLGSTASAVLHRAATPVLIARTLAEDSALADRVVVATDGSDDAHRGVELAGRIAAGGGAPVLVVSVDTGPTPDLHHIAEDAMQLATEVGATPVSIRLDGDPAKRIAEVAASEHATLVVVGSRGRTGLRALGSVSERVGHEVRCSVLVARPRR